MANTGVNLLIIDPQNDFYQTNDETIKGSLGVGGSQGDIERIIRMINNGKNNIKSINVSLDTHTRNHIANASFWKIKGTDKAAPDSKMVNAKNEKDNKVFYADGIEIEPRLSNDISEADKEILKVWFKTYCDLVNQPGRNGLMLWPDHCIEETDGHAVVPDLKTALDNVSTQNSIPIPVAYHIKGQNCLTEMFSIMKADIDIDDVSLPDQYKETLTKYMYTGSTATQADGNPLRNTETSFNANTDKTDHVYLNTKFNKDLFDKLVEGGRPIAICGEALTHCVLNSFVDIVNKIQEEAQKGNTQITQQVWLIANASSPISDTEGPAIEKYKNHVFKNGNDGELKKFIKFKKIEEDGSLVDILPNKTDGDKIFDEFLRVSGLVKQEAALGGRRTRRNRRRPSATRKAKAPKNNRSARRNRRRVRSRSV